MPVSLRTSCEMSEQRARGGRRRADRTPPPHRRATQKNTSLYSLRSARARSRIAGSSPSACHYRWTRCGTAGERRWRRTWFAIFWSSGPLVLLDRVLARCGVADPNILRGEPPFPLSSGGINSGPKGVNLATRSPIAAMSIAAPLCLACWRSDERHRMRAKRPDVYVASRQFIKRR